MSKNNYLLAAKLKVIYLWRNRRKEFLLVSILAIVYFGSWLTLVIISEQNRFQNEQFVPHSIGEGYDTIADNLLARSIFSQRTHEPYLSDEARTPIYPFFIAGIKYATGSFSAVPFFQILLVILSSLMIFILASEFMGGWYAFSSALIFGLEPSNIFFNMLLLTEGLFVFFIIAFIYFFTLPSIRTSLSPIIRYFFCGSLLGLATLTRPIAMFLVIVFSVFLIIHERVKKWSIVLIYLLLFCAGFFLTVLPWAVRNYKLSGVLSLSSISSHNLFEYNVAPFLARKNHKSFEETTATLREEAGINNENEQIFLKNSASLDRVSKSYLKENILSYSLYHLVKTIPFYVASSLEGVYYNVNKIVFHRQASEGLSVNLTDLLIKRDFMGFFRSFFMPVYVGVEIIFWALVLLAGIYGVVRKPNFMTVAFIVLVIYFGILTGPVSTARYRMPAVPFMIVLAIKGVFELRLVNKKERKI